MNILVKAMDIGKPKLGEVSIVPNWIKKMEKIDTSKNKTIDDTDIKRSSTPLIFGLNLL